MTLSLLRAQCAPSVLGCALALAGALALSAVPGPLRAESRTTHRVGPESATVAPVERRAIKRGVAQDSVAQDGIAPDGSSPDRATLDSALREDTGLPVQPDGAAEDTMRSLRIGDTALIVPVRKGYRYLDQMLPEQAALIRNALPQEAELLDMHMHAGQDEIDIHDTSPWVHYQIFAIPAVNALQLNPRQWNYFRRQTMEAMERLDLDALAGKNRQRVNKAFGDAGIDELRIESADLAKPRVYREDARSLRMITTLGTVQAIEGKTYDIEEVRAVAMLYVRGQVLYVVAGREFPAGRTEPLGVIDALNAYVDDVLRLNP